MKTRSSLGPDRIAGSLPETMQAWRVHAWGSNPNEAMSLDTIPVPVPEAGELLVRVQAIPLNLNDMERINGERSFSRSCTNTLPIR